MEISKNVTWKSLGDKVVAVKVDSGEYFTMNEVASTIWHGISEGKDVAEIVSSIMQEYDNDNAEEVRSDVEEQISEWKNESLLTL